MLLCACDRENKETVARPAMRLQYSAFSLCPTVVLFIYFLLAFLFFLSFYLSVVDCLISFYLYLFFLSCCCNFIKFKYSSLPSQFNNL